MTSRKDMYINIKHKGLWLRRISQKTLKLKRPLEENICNQNRQMIHIPTRKQLLKINRKKRRQEQKRKKKKYNIYYGIKTISIIRQKQIKTGSFLFLTFPKTSRMSLACQGCEETGYKRALVGLIFGTALSGRSKGRA